MRLLTRKISFWNLAFLSCYLLICLKSFAHLSVHIGVCADFTTFGATLAVIAVQLFRTKQREDAVLRSKSQYLYRLMHRISSLHALF